MLTPSISYFFFFDFKGWKGARGTGVSGVRLSCINNNCQTQESLE